VLAVKAITNQLTAANPLDQACKEALTIKTPRTLAVLLAVNRVLILELKSLSLPFLALVLKKE
jgi:hypothetical protein